MRNRFQNAHEIQEHGACNPSGIARALVEAIDEARGEGVPAAKDPAVRLICHQLAFLLNIDGMNRGDDWTAARVFCRMTTAQREAFTEYHGRWITSNPEGNGYGWAFDVVDTRDEPAVEGWWRTGKEEAGPGSLFMHIEPDGSRHT